MSSDFPLAGRRVLVFVGDIYEDLDLWYPKLRLIEAGATVVVAGPEAGQKYAGKNGYPCVSDAAINDYFGYSVSVSGDGTTAVIGAFFKNSHAGAAYVFNLPPTTFPAAATMCYNRARPVNHFHQ